MPLQGRRILFEFIWSPVFILYTSLRSVCMWCMCWLTHWAKHWMHWKNIVKCLEKLKGSFTSLHYAVNPLSAPINFQFSWSSVSKLLLESQTKEGVVIWTDYKFGKQKQTYSKQCGSEKCASLYDPSYSNFLFQPWWELTFPRLSITSRNLCSPSHRDVIQKNENANAVLSGQANS